MSSIDKNNDSMQNSRDRVAGPEELDAMFRDLEQEVTAEFTAVDAEEIWGGGVDRAPSGETITGTNPRSSAAPDANAWNTDPSPDVADVSVMLSMHSDGSASMTMPGASVTLSQRRASVTSGAEYEIGEILGQGGMGVVNAARQASLDRRIVVKSIRREYAGMAEAQEKFITEALATGSLDHPNVVPIHDMGVSEDGSLFYVMKEVRGKNWRTLLPTLSESENIDILFRVADAVACAHDKGIIHRDLKPENVMLGDYGEVLVMDWGLAAAISPTAKAARLGDANACAGTPSFMAPEMARGAGHELGPWSDQYLLGGTLFNILTGTPPHPGKTAKEAVRNAANNVLRETTRNDEWMNVARRAMHAVPHRRYPSVKAFQKALRNCRVHSESIVLANKGDEHLALAEKSGRHEDYTRAVNSYEQALVLWAENENAGAKLREAKFGNARNAVKQGDFALALSLLSGVEDNGGRGAALAARAREGLRQREARRRMVRILGIVAAGLLLLVAAVAGVSYVIISRQAEAEHQAKVEADSQRAIAEEQRERAVSALAAAEEAREAETHANELRLRETNAKLAAEGQARERAEEALLAREEIQRLGYLEDNSRWRFDAATAVRRQREDSEKFNLPVEKSAPAGILMRLIPAGEYVMGSPPRDPSRNSDEYLHEVAITHPFYLSATEITRGQWREIVGTERLEDLGLQPGDEGVRDVLWRVRPLPEGDGLFPASGVSYDDVTEIFMPALAKRDPEGRYRLPTEAEWEWAARAGTTGHFHSGDTEKDLDAAAWYEANSYGRAHRAGGKDPNPWGLHDMMGNVWEMNLDAYDSLYYLRSPKNDPVNTAPSDPMRVTRGGSYINSPRWCRMSYRSTSMHRQNRYPHAGFRLAWSDRRLRKEE